MEKQFPPQLLRTLPKEIRENPMIPVQFQNDAVPWLHWLVWLQPLLELRIFYLNRWLSLNRPPSGKIGSILRGDYWDVLKTLHGKVKDNFDPRNVYKVHEQSVSKSLNNISFFLTHDLRLAPRWDDSSSHTMLWGYAAQSLVEIKGIGFERLKLCFFQENKDGLCMNLFWDESKNKVRKYCDEKPCIRNRSRARVSIFRKKGAK